MSRKHENGHADRHDDRDDRHHDGHEHHIGGKFIVGTDGDDVLNGTNKSEFLFGRAGDDQILAGAGNDTAFGGKGDDLIDGGTGNDDLFGGRGNDGLVGGDGNDQIDGGAGNDLLIGGAGRDTLDGGDGKDKFVIRTGTGVDTIKHLEADDRIDLRDFGFASAQDVLNAFHQVGHNAVLDLGGGDKLVLDHVHVADLDAARFVVSDAETGVSSSQSPYVVGVDPTISTVSLLTTGDQVGFKSDGVTPWRMAGTPDGLGAFDNGDGTFTVLMGHEFASGDGVVRDHGAKGSFISELTIDKTTLAVTHAEDLIQQFHLFDAATDSYIDASPAISRFCSADLAGQTAFYNPLSGLGYDGGRIFLNGEESGTEGRAFAHIATGAEAGNSYELGWLGNLAFENVVANAHAGDKTVVAETDDGTNGQVYFYFGDKQATGSAIDQAGLTHGNLYGLKVDGLVDETNGTAPITGASFSLVNLGDVNDLSGAQIDAQSEAAGVTSFLRPEDGAWDTIDHDRFYFVTTASFSGNSRLWAVDFNDASNPDLGGTVSMLLEGTEGQKMMDNITVTNDGKVLIQEDPGNQTHIAKVWQYDPSNDQLTLLAQHDPDRFAPGGTNFITQDEESSGIIDVTDILGSAGQQAYLLADQVHLDSADPELVEGGQLLVMYHDMV